MSWRKWLLALYAATALGDAAGKILVRDPYLRDVIARALAGHDAKFAARVTAKPANNLDIFRTSSRNLGLGRDLYAEYPTEHGDRFKYSPAFAVLFAPLAVLPWAASLVIWNLLNALLLFYALAKVLPREHANVMLAAVLPEVWRNIQSAQSNCIVAALMILAFVALRQRRLLRGALFIALGTAIKLFPLVAALFALPSRRRAHFAGALALCLLAAAVLPLAVTTPAQLAMQYASWRAIELVDAQQQGTSLIALINSLTRSEINTLALQLAGAFAVALPLLRFPQHWRHRKFSVHLLASVLLFAVLFNHQAERPSYIVAFAGIALWYAASPRTRTETVLFALSFVLIPIASNFLPSSWVGSPQITLLRLVVPCLLIWLYIQFQLNGFLLPSLEKQPRPRPQPAPPSLSETHTLDA